jgi:hypothetical protein
MLEAGEEKVDTVASSSLLNLPHPSVTFTGFESSIEVDDEAFGNKFLPTISVTSGARPVISRKN